MIAKFNFYDVYGYFLPGLVLLTLLWLPFGMSYRQWPSGELVTALIAIPLSYIAGHLIQAFAVRVLPSTAEGGRYPSDVILDDANVIFSSEFKVRLAAKIKEMFGIDVNSPTSASRQRNDALFVCRSVLIKAKTASYGEQFEGMYSLMRGLALAFLMGAVHTAGWFLAFIDVVRPWALPCLFGAVCAAIALEFWQAPPPAKQSRKKAIASLVAVALTLLCGGYALAQNQSTSLNLRHLLLGVTLLTAFLSRKCYHAYKSFTWEFAKAVYRDFATYEKPHGEDKSKTE